MDNIAFQLFIGAIAIACLIQGTVTFAWPIREKAGAAWIVAGIIPAILGVILWWNANAVLALIWGSVAAIGVAKLWWSHREQRHREQLHREVWAAFFNTEPGSRS